MASKNSRGFRGYCGYFQESKQSCGFAESLTRGYFVDVQEAVDSSVDVPLLCLCA